MSHKKAAEVSALDIRFLLAEWEFLQGAFIRKIYHTSGKDWKLLFELFVQQKGTHYLHVFPAYITLNKQKGSVQNIRKEGGKAAFGPESPSGFCMSLRKHLSGKRIERISQHGFDRILEFSAGGMRLVLEFVPPGNAILTDSEGIIISALTTKKWRDRDIRVRTAYQYPPERPDPFSLGIGEFRKYFQQSRKAVVVLASDLGLGSEYANRLCDDAKVRPDKNAQALTESELKALFGKITSLERVHKSEPFVEIRDKDMEKLKWIEKQRTEALEKWKSAEKLAKERADAIYRKFDTVQAILEKFSSKKDIGFEPIESKEGLHITVKLDGVDVPLDLKKSGQDNAAFYYEQSKKARRKVASLESSLRKPIEFKPPEGPEHYADQETSWPEGAEAPSLHRWFQKFKWFISSDGLLVIAGKNAEQNELILNTRAEPGEWCFHADIKGAAFTVIKSGLSGGKAESRLKASADAFQPSPPSDHNEPPEQTKKEAAEFAAVNSKAWTKGLGTVTVFSVLRKNLSKNPPIGMSLPKGSFVVYGQKVWYRNIPLRIAIGADPEGKISSGPESAIRKAFTYAVILTPGRRKASDLSRDIKSNLMRQSKPRDLPVLQKLSLDGLERHVPFGFGEIVGK